MADAKTVSHVSKKGAEEIPSWLWLWAPLILLVASFVVGFTAPGFYARVFETEFGVIENLQVLFLLIALILSASACYQARQSDFDLRVLWLLVYALATFLFIGEEISWGQHFVGWEAEGIFAVRGQRETNLHNIHPLLARAPRAIVVVAILLGAVVFVWTPLGGILARRLPGGETFWLWALPSKTCSLTAMLILVAKLPKRVYRWSGIEETHWPGLNDNELLEAFVAYFFLLYAVLLWRRIKFEAN